MRSIWLFSILSTIGASLYCFFYSGAFFGWYTLYTKHNTPIEKDVGMGYLSALCGVFLGELAYMFYLFTILLEVQ